MKRRTATVFGVVVILLLVGGVALAATITGTNKDETLVGTAYADTIMARGGGDVLRGLGGAVRLYGSDGADSVYGGRGKDFISTEGDDVKDFVDCGPGNDIVKLVNLVSEPTEMPDTYRNCEQHSVRVLGGLAISVWQAIACPS